MYYSAYAAFVWFGRLISSRYLSHLEPGQHKLLGREVRRPKLVVGNQGPDEAQDQLQVAVVDVGVA